MAVYRDELAGGESKQSASQTQTPKARFCLRKSGFGFPSLPAPVRQVILEFPEFWHSLEPCQGYSESGFCFF